MTPSGGAQGGAQPPAERVLIYDRIGTNRRDTVFLLLGFIVFVALFFAAIGAIVAIYSGVAQSDLPRTILVFAGVSAAIAVPIGIIMYYSAAQTTLAISGAREVTKEQEPDLHRVVENLSIGSGLPMPRVWVIDDMSPNAFATGRDPRHAHVVATVGLLQKLDKRELEAVMAHEMSHVGNYDIRLATTIVVVVGLIALATDVMLRFTWYGAGARPGNRDRGGGGLYLIILILAILFVAISPLIAALIRLAISRQREYLADASGALLSRDPEALADALEKITADPKPLGEANKATAHLYFANPLKGHESFLNDLFSTHPPPEKRIALLRAMG